jgi:hypothetical protein
MTNDQKEAEAWSELKVAEKKFRLACEAFNVMENTSSKMEMLSPAWDHLKRARKNYYDHQEKASRELKEAEERLSARS